MAARGAEKGNSGRQRENVVCVVMTFSTLDINGVWSPTLLVVP